jgi:hypothetical protein
VSCIAISPRHREKRQPGVAFTESTIVPTPHPRVERGFYLEPDNIQDNDAHKSGNCPLLPQRCLDWRC